MSLQHEGNGAFPTIGYTWALLSFRSVNAFGSASAFASVPERVTCGSCHFVYRC